MTFSVDTGEFLTAPFQHQIVGVQFLVEKHVSALLDEMGAGKSKQFIDTACVLWYDPNPSRHIDTFLIVCPASVKSTWAGKEDGQVVQHCWAPYFMEEYSSRNDVLHRSTGLHIIVTNYEFIRIKERLQRLMFQLQGKKIMVVFDESSFIKSPKAAQTRACLQLRKMCKRAHIANGAPINNSLQDLYAPFAVLDKNIIGCENQYVFRNRYCVMGGYQNKQIIGYRNIDYLQRRLAPYILRRLKEDCLDLPPKLYNSVEVPLTDTTWRVYREMRDDMISWLDTQTAVITINAIVKLVRLSQLTSGMIGGLNRTLELMKTMGMSAPLPLEELEDQVEITMDPADIRVISNEKHQYVVDWVQERIAEEPNFRVILWTRFRKEQEILANMLGRFSIRTLRIMGGQKKPEREETIRAFNQPSDKPLVLLGQPKAGGIGTNLQAECSWALYVSNDYSQLTRQQSEDRIHRPGQKASTVNYMDVLATGPKGQKTIDHAIKRALVAKDALATKTTAYWRAAIAEE